MIKKVVCICVCIYIYINIYINCLSLRYEKPFTELPYFRRTFLVEFVPFTKLGDPSRTVLPEPPNIEKGIHIEKTSAEIR